MNKNNKQTVKKGIELMQKENRAETLYSSSISKDDALSIKNSGDLNKLWMRGRSKESFFAPTNQEANAVREAYLKNLLEHDLVEAGFKVSPQDMRTFLKGYAKYHADVLNATEVARAMGISTYAINYYLDVLQKLSVVRFLNPWHQDLTKRQVKTNKIYFKDSGVFHTLLGTIDQEKLYANEKLASSWKGFVLEEIISHYNARPEDCYFWSTHAGTWLDLFLIIDGKRIGFEFKCIDKPKVKPAMKISVEDLKLDHLYVIYPGHETLVLSDRITAMGLQEFVSGY